MIFRPHKVHVVQESKAHDRKGCANFGKWFTAFVADQAANMLDKTFFTN